MILACCHPLIIVLIVRILFTYPEKFKSLLSLLSGVHQFRFINSQLSVIILLSYRCFVQVISNQLVISSFSWIWILSNIFVHLLILTGDSFLYFVRFSILMMVCSRVLFLLHHINSVVVPILPVVCWRPSQVDAISILILSMRINNMPNPLIVINLIGEG